MARTKSKNEITEKEEEIMQLLWHNGPLTVRQMVELFPEPRPHFNTVSTFVRGLERKGFVNHHERPMAFVYYAVAKMEDFRRRTFGNFIKNYFGNSYFGAVSTLVEEEKITADELRELIDIVEKRDQNIQ